MAVKVGSARSDERGRASGGKAGDQKNGKEVSTQNWYKHSKGWRVLRAKDPGKAARIARCMKAACANDNIGYDQHDRLTLYRAARDVGFDCSRVTTPCETDCSALVRVCLAYAGISTANFTTYGQARELLGTGEFVEMKGTKYTNKSDYLRAGDVLVTRTQGHTVVVLNDGPRAEVAPEPDKTYALGERLLKNGMEGADVKDLQEALIQLGYDCGRWGADGDFGDATELAVRAFQRAAGLDADGEYGPLTHAALVARMDALDGAPEEARLVRIVGGDCWVRTAPNTGGERLGVARAGTELRYGGEATEDGWLLVEYESLNGWVSGRYGRVVA